MRPARLAGNDKNPEDSLVGLRYMSDLKAKKQRPVWFNLSPVNLPLPGLVSIVHRVSGILLFVGIVWFLFLLDMSLTSPLGYAHFTNYMAHPLVKLVMFTLLWAYMHHFCAGVRYLLMDIHVGVKLPAARTSSFAVFAVSIILTLILGVRLW